ncbi:MAG: Brp/Blh family beta-carotene 15,15'-dioxygenase, partial [Flavicella sp.]
IKYSLYLAYGVFLFCILFYTNYEEVQVLLQSMFAVSLSKNSLTVLTLLSGVPLLLLLFIHSNEKDQMAWMFKELLYLSVLFVFFWAAPLIIAFAVYFIIWHSVPSIKDQISYLYGNTSLYSTLSYLKKSLLFWGISLLFLMGIYFYFKESQLFDAVLFAILFVVTVPHTLVIFWMHWRIKHVQNNQ